MKRALFGVLVAVATVALMATPAAAQTVVKESSCTETYGSNTMTYDCGFNVKDYVLGAPVTFTVNYACSGTCGPLQSFGMRGRGFTPGDVSGRLIRGKRVSNGLELTFVFDALHVTSNGSVGNAHFKATVPMDDGTGKLVPGSCTIDVHLME